MPSEGNGEWNLYAKKVLDELKRHDKWLEKLDLNLNNHITEIATTVTEIKVNQKAQTKLFYVVLTTLVGMFGMIFVQMVL